MTGCGGFLLRRGGSVVGGRLSRFARFFRTDHHIVAPSNWCADRDRVYHPESNVLFKTCFYLILPVHRNGYGCVTGDRLGVGVYHEPQWGTSHFG